MDFNPVPPQTRFLAGVNIDSGGMGFQKEVKLSVPKPANMPADAVPFVAQPSVHTNADGTQEKVYVVHDSAKVLNGRLTTASPPFDGVLGYGPFVFLFTPAPLDGPVVISGYTYRDMDGIGGYLPGPGENNDKPIKGAVIRSAAAYNLISYSREDGHYAAFGFSTLDVCRSFATTAIHPQTMYRHTANITTCDVPYIVNNFNFRLADQNTQIPDTTAPVITMNMQVVPGQADDPRFTAGTVPVNTEIQVPVTILDQAMGTATLTVTYKTPDMNAGQNHSVTLVQAGSTIHTYISAQNPAPVYNYTYTAGFNFPIAGSSAGSFKPQNAGTYTFNLEATDAAGNRSSRSMTVRAIQPGTSPDGVDGPPQVDELVPADGAKEIMVTMPVMVTFNEPVENVTTETLKLFSLDYDPNTQQTYENPVAATVYTSLEGGRVRATLQPRTNLTFGRNYKIVVSTGITDAVPNSAAMCAAQNPPQPDGCLLPLIRQYTAVFTTKVPQIYDLDEGQFTGGKGIDLYTDPADGKTYAYVTADAEGWYVIDVTDPTSPAVVKTNKMTNAGVTWMDRGVDVDQDNSLLALTEDIRYVSGNQYGYIRFYDLTNNPQGSPPTTPANPRLVGREKIAEAYSGVPMRLSLMNNYAYVATVNVGLQVVDINAAKEFMQSGQQADGSTIVGIFDTWGSGYRNPTDIVAYKGGRAALTTTSGHLVLLDINMPQLPQEMTAFKPELGPNNPLNFDSAWRVAVAPEYAYTPSPLAGEGGGEGTQVIDLAVTGSMAGRIHTVDITDPYNPVVLGVAKDGIGNEVMAPVTDITISKGSGLVYATAGMSVYIIDIKDPYNPVLLNVVTQTPTEPGSTTMIALGGSNALVEKDGWVYLANQNQGMRVLDLDPQDLGIEPDSEFPKVVIPEMDYYPALGTKLVTIYGVISGVPLNNEWGLYLAEPLTINGLRVGGGLDSQGVPASVTTDQNFINRFTANEGAKKGFAPMYILWSAPANTQPPDNFTIKIQARKIGATTLSAATSTKVYTFTFKIRHNGNVTLNEVMNDKAVFVYDRGTIPAPASFPTFFGLGEQKSFRYVQELLNQVVPRKREDVPANYSLVNEEGRYDDNVEIAVRTFRTAFMNSNGANGINVAGERIGNTRAVYTVGPDGAVEYQNNDNTTDTFRKLMKNYNHRGTPTASGDWLHRIIDRRTLVGGKQRIDSALGGLLADNEPDKLVNGAPGNTKNDTGLYELYKNVVEKFIEYMITEGQRYADYSVNYRARADATAGALLQLRDNTPVGNPDGQVDQDVDDLEVTRGVSYSYGDIDTPEQFAAVVNQPNIANWRNYTNGHKPGKHTYEHAYWQQGQRNPANFNPGDWPTTWPPSGTIIIAYSYDLLSPDMWGGIDCNGFVQRVVNHSDESATSSQLGVDTKVQRLQTIHDKKSRAYFSDTDRSYTINTNNVSWIRKSDIVQYMNAAEHIALVHSDRPTACVAQGSQTTCTYNIIHAYGRDSVDLGTPESPDPTFTRRVRVNSNSEPNMPNPTGFGRIKLWN